MESARREQSVRELREYFIAAIARRQNDPREDLTSQLVHARDEDEALTEDELLAFVVLLLLAGNETTTNLISNGVLALLRNPDQQALLRERPDLVPAAVEEFLRYDGPVQGTSRVVAEPVTLHGVDLAAGDVVFPMLAAANRDEAHFPDGERLDITRQRNDHIAFGEYIHICLGAPLARLEACVAFERLLARLPAMSPAVPEATLTYRPAFILRGLDRLPVVARPG